MNQESYQSDKHSATSHRIFPLNNSLFAVKSWCPNHEGAMFFRTKTSGPRSYLQIVENRWEEGRPRQRVLATLGRLDQLQQSGQLDALWPRAPAWPSPSSCCRPTPRGNSRPSPPAASAPPSSSSGSGGRRDAAGSSRDSSTGAASSATSSGPSSSPSCTASSPPAATGPPTSGGRTTRSTAAAPCSC